MGSMNSPTSNIWQLNSWDDIALIHLSARRPNEDAYHVGITTVNGFQLHANALDGCFSVGELNGVMVEVLINRVGRDKVRPWGGMVRANLIHTVDELARRTLMRSIPDLVSLEIVLFVILQDYSRRMRARNGNLATRIPAVVRFTPAPNSHGQRVDDSNRRHR